MRTIWTWAAIILVSMCIVILLVGVRSEQAAYEAARGVVVRTAQQSEAKMPPGHWLLIRRMPRPQAGQ